jgi:hypothetical protein
MDAFAKITKNRGTFASDAAVLKLIYLALTQNSLALHKPHQPSRLCLFFSQATAQRNATEADRA